MDLEKMKREIVDVALTGGSEQVARVHAACRKAERAKQTCTSAEAIKMLGGIHRRTLTRYSQAGHLHPIRHSAWRILWDRVEVERLATEGIDVD